MSGERQIKRDGKALRWCATHDQPTWVYSDGSVTCPHDPEADEDDGVYRAKINGTCVECRRPYSRGDRLERVGLGRFVHFDGCPPTVTDTDTVAETVEASWPTSSTPETWQELWAEWVPVPRAEWEALEDACETLKFIQDGPADRAVADAAEALIRAAAGVSDE